MRHRHMDTSGASKVNIFPIIQMIQNMLERLSPSPPYNMSGATLSLLQPLWGDIPAPPYPGLEVVRNKKNKIHHLKGPVKAG